MADKSFSCRTFPQRLRRTKTPVTMFLVKGVKLQGIVTWFDTFSLLLRRDGVSQLMYKHTISTIMPSHVPVDLLAGLDRELAKRRTARPIAAGIFLAAAEKQTSR